MGSTNERSFVRLNVAFRCDASRGVYMPIAQFLACEFCSIRRSPMQNRQDGVLGNHPRNGSPPPDELVESVVISAEGDPYSPEDHDKDKGLFSLDGYAPECAYDLAGAFLSCVASGYEPRVTLSSRSLTFEQSTHWRKGNGVYWAEAPQEARGAADFVKLELSRRCRRGIQTRAGAFAGTLPDILVLPIIVTIVAGDRAQKEQEDI